MTEPFTSNRKEISQNRDLPAAKASSSEGEEKTKTASTGKIAKIAKSVPAIKIAVALESKVSVSSAARPLGGGIVCVTGEPNGEIRQFKIHPEKCR